LAEDFAARYSEADALNWIRLLWQSDRWSDYAAFRRTAQYAAGELRRLGAGEVEQVECAADGATRVQAWTMPLAWEAGESVLRIMSPHVETLCDRSREPLSCTMWSEPTPPGGVRGPLVVVDDPQGIPAQERSRLRGAFILTRRSGRGQMKVFAHEVGAAAVVSHLVPHGERHADAIGWSNGWSDDDGGWALKASDCRMTGFQISPPEGERLRRLLTNGPVTCEATVGGRIGEGVLPVVTGVLPGRSDEEVLLVGHLYETGAIDNASGGGVMLEALRLMSGMPAPRRRVRILLTAECYGTYAFFTQRPGLLGRTVAGIDVDCVGEAETDERPHLWYRTPEANPSAVDTLFRAVMEVTEGRPGGRRAQEEAHGLSDNAISDPAAGVPTVLFMRSPWTWHTSLDDWSGIAPLSVRRAAVATATYVRWLAEANAADADSLAEAALIGASAAYPADGELTATRRAFFLDRARARVLWTKRLGARQAEAVAEKLPALDLKSLVGPVDGGEEEQRTVPVRAFWGAPTFDAIPASDRCGLADPRWSTPHVSACYWADGRRTVAEIAALVRTECGSPAADIAALFHVLERGSLVRLQRV
jgi:hypothetical protein